MEQIECAKRAVDPFRSHHCAYRLILGPHVSVNSGDAITLRSDRIANLSFSAPDEVNYSGVIVDCVFESFVELLSDERSFVGLIIRYYGNVKFFNGA